MLSPSANGTDGLGAADPKMAAGLICGSSYFQTGRLLCCKFWYKFLTGTSSRQDWRWEVSNTRPFNGGGHRQSPEDLKTISMCCEMRWENPVLLWFTCFNSKVDSHQQKMWLNLPKMIKKKKKSILRLYLAYLGILKIWIWGSNSNFWHINQLKQLLIKQKPTQL